MRGISVCTCACMCLCVAVRVGGRRGVGGGEYILWFRSSFGYPNHVYSLATTLYWSVAVFVVVALVTALVVIVTVCAIVLMTTFICCCVCFVFCVVVRARISL